jgi:hypothetical protein
VSGWPAASTFRRTASDSRSRGSAAEHREHVGLHVGLAREIALDARHTSIEDLARRHLCAACFGRVRDLEDVTQQCGHLLGLVPLALGDRGLHRKSHGRRGEQHDGARGHRDAGRVASYELPCAVAEGVWPRRDGQSREMTTASPIICSADP